MNYRHAFHAGNFADVMKHVVLTRILVHLARKATPFRVIDTHAGPGLYDLAGSEAARTGEWRAGIGRLDQPLPEAAERLLAPYRTVIAATRARFGGSAYPGSPALIRELLRPNDRAILIEKHPDEAEALAARFNAAGTTKVLRADGWTGLGGLIPPRERRGLVLIDPPYEEPDELARAVGRLGRASLKWPTGIMALWYPIKDAGETQALAEAVTSLGLATLRLELLIDSPAPGRDRRLFGSGLVVVNPPWTLAEEAGLIVPALADRLGRPGHSGFRVEPSPT